jgi:hypothetical protein
MCRCGRPGSYRDSSLWLTPPNLSSAGSLPADWGAKGAWGEMQMLALYNNTGLVGTVPPSWVDAGSFKAMEQV